MILNYSGLDNIQLYILQFGGSNPNSEQAIITLQLKPM